MNPTIVMTGATSGIGAVAALELARQGARIVFVARSSERARVTLKALHEVNPRSEHAAHFADLSSIEQMKRVGAAIAVSEARIDALINNAGAIFMGSQSTAEGLSPTFALNHLAYYVLTLQLLPALRAASAARILCTASRAHRFGHLDFDHLQRNGIAGYAASKLANILFVRELARRLAGSTVTACCFHPGFVATRFADNTALPWSLLMRLRKAVHGLTPRQGAQTLLQLASGPEPGHNGGYYVRGVLTEPSPQARSDAAAARLWACSAELTGLDW